MLGDARSRLFRDDSDRERFLGCLSERVEQFNIRLYLFTLMTNHFHLVFETPEGNCSKFMQSLSTAYTVYFNLRHKRHGHLFDGRYKAKLVEGDDYLLALSRYVHLNPVQIPSMKEQEFQDKVRCLREYPWSTYQSYIGQRKKLPYITYAPVLAVMGGSTGVWSKRYKAFVESGLAECDEDFKASLKASPRSIGSDSFRAKIDMLYEKLTAQSQSPEDISFRRITEPLAPQLVLEIIGEVMDAEIEEFRQRRRGSYQRGVAARYLCKYASLTQREVAHLLNMSTGAAVSQQMRKLSEALIDDRKLREVLNRVDRKLEEMRKPCV
jgi:REP element-mobilizing transposase RayT